VKFPGGSGDDVPHDVQDEQATDAGLFQGFLEDRPADPEIFMSI